jgi:DNA polymerase/3'-5' exonuclease PolX
MAEVISDAIAPLCRHLLVAGAIRRAHSEVGDIELVALPGDLDSFLEGLGALGYHGGRRSRRKLLDGFPIEIHVAHAPEELGALTLATTGDRLMNIALRKKATARGWMLNPYGLWDARTLRPVLVSAYEGDYFDKLGMDYIEPESRSLLNEERAAADLGCSSMDCYEDLDK